MRLPASIPSQTSHSIPGLVAEVGMGLTGPSSEVDGSSPGESLRAQTSVHMLLIFLFGDCQPSLSRDWQSPSHM